MILKKKMSKGGRVKNLFVKNFLSKKIPEIKNVINKKMSQHYHHIYVCGITIKFYKTTSRIYLVLNLKMFLISHSNNKIRTLPFLLNSLCILYL